MFWDILNGNQRKVLEKILENMPLPGSYLAGGTALALILGHRESVDFDWFVREDFDPERLEYLLSQMGQLKTVETKKGTYHGFLDGVRVTWLRYPNPLIEPLESEKDFYGLLLPSITDIALMKLAAVSHRGAKKDFIDLYSICKTGISVEYLMDLLPRKFPDADINYYHMVKSLSYFDDAEREQMPIMRIQLVWEDVKEFFLDAQNNLVRKYIQS
ncbi:MAG: nucleotidyl transferase AbiEii/AbiGii toxin family protein [Clostridia bacterium]|jgi:hypothetical protein|nr:nucleotidyl transferase AbiEii/AbiGii toxin family protein [Clostridiales bacterium]